MSKIAFFEKGKKGDGPAFVKRVVAAISSARSKKFPSFDRSENSGPKQGVGR